jgi:hypothetical protein
VVCEGGEEKAIFSQPWRSGNWSLKKVGKDEVHQKALGYWNRPRVGGSIAVSKFQDTHRVAGIKAYRCKRARPHLRAKGIE